MTETTKEVPEQKLEPFHPTCANVSISGRNFVDPLGRILDLRGVNVGASSKIPLYSQKFDNYRTASYLNRPFPLSEAPTHWARLKSWGLTFIRLNITWDAIEHSGPGIYDEEYLGYLKGLVEGMKEFGLVVYIGVHQDVWSRYCGGSGAPGWTLELAGFDLSNDGEKLALSGAAFLDGIKGGRLGGDRGLWPTGYQKLAAVTMNTLFWGGETFAPSLTITSRGGKANIQRYLQDAFLGAVGKLVEAVGDLDSVLGFELLNEPHPGFIGLQSIHEWNYNTDLHLGQFPSPLQAFSLGAGHPTKVPNYTRSFPYPTRKTSTVLANPTSANAWSNKQCPWEKEGVWRWSEQKQRAFALQEDYFSKDRKGEKVDFYQDFYFPFVKRWEAVIKGKLGSGKGKGKMRMVEALPNEFCPTWPEGSRPENFVYAPHWYDLNVLFKKQFGNMTVNVQGLSRGMFVLKALYFGEKGVKKNYRLQIRKIVEEARKSLGEVPVVFGECGVPMDINNEQAFRNGDWKWQERMMNAIVSAYEKSMVGFNLWTYNPSNRDDIGDDWNAENFSWYSDANRDKVIAAKGEKAAGDLDAGARLLDVIVRPYAIATAGKPLSIDYDPTTTIFTHRWVSPFKYIFPDNGEVPPTPNEITEIYLPKRVYPEGKVKHFLSSGGRIQFDYPNQRAWVWFADPLPSFDARPKKDTHRRVDIWVPQPTPPTSIWVYLVWLVVLGLAVYIAFWAQERQDRQNKAWGLPAADWKDLLLNTDMNKGKGREEL